MKKPIIRIRAATSSSRDAVPHRGPVIPGLAVLLMAATVTQEVAAQRSANTTTILVPTSTAGPTTAPPSPPPPPTTTEAPNHTWSYTAARPINNSQSREAMVSASLSSSGPKDADDNGAGRHDEDAPKTTADVPVAVTTFRLIAVSLIAVLVCFAVPARSITMGMSMAAVAVLQKVMRPVLLLDVCTRCLTGADPDRDGVAPEIPQYLFPVLDLTSSVAPSLIPPPKPAREPHNVTMTLSQSSVSLSYSYSPSFTEPVEVPHVGDVPTGLGLLAGAAVISVAIVVLVSFIVASLVHSSAGDKPSDLPGTRIMGMVLTASLGLALPGVAAAGSTLVMYGVTVEARLVGGLLLATAAVAGPLLTRVMREGHAIDMFNGDIANPQAQQQSKTDDNEGDALSRDSPEGVAAEGVNDNRGNSPLSDQTGKFDDVAGDRRGAKEWAFAHPGAPPVSSDEPRDSKTQVRRAYRRVAFKAAFAHWYDGVRDPQLVSNRLVAVMEVVGSIALGAAVGTRPHSRMTCMAVIGAEAGGAAITTLALLFVRPFQTPQAVVVAVVLSLLELLEAGQGLVAVATWDPSQEAVWAGQLSTIAAVSVVQLLGFSVPFVAAVSHALYRGKGTAGDGASGADDGGDDGSAAENAEGQWSNLGDDAPEPVLLVPLRQDWRRKTSPFDPSRRAYIGSGRNPLDQGEAGRFVTSVPLGRASLPQHTAAGTALPQGEEELYALV